MMRQSRPVHPAPRGTPPCARHSSAVASGRPCACQPCSGPPPSEPPTSIGRQGGKSPSIRGRRRGEGRTDYLTGQPIGRWNGWAAVAGTTERVNGQDAAAGPLTHDRLYHASVEYQFTTGFTLGLGWKRERQPVAIDPNSAFGRIDTLGALAMYVLEF
jgi:hypothetical protein